MARRKRRNPNRRLYAVRFVEKGDDEIVVHFECDKGHKSRRTYGPRDGAWMIRRFVKEGGYWTRAQGGLLGTCLACDRCDLDDSRPRVV